MYHAYKEYRYREACEGLTVAAVRGEVHVVARLSGGQEVVSSTLTTPTLQLL